MKKNKTKTVIFNPKKMLLSDKSAFSVKEAYKTLRTNVMFSLPGKESKCIGIVSPERGDGKSSVAINLAISFSQINKKVIIVDCDLRLPTIASKLGIEAKPGLSNFLSGNQDSDQPLIRRSSEYGIDIMKKAVDFIFNAGIDDLHGGNFGFNKNGKPIIVDYSGFDS